MAPSNKHSDVKGGAVRTYTKSHTRIFTNGSFNDYICSTLVRQPFDIPSVSSNGQKGFKENVILIRAKEKHSLAIDFKQFTSIHFKEKELLAILREQYPTGLGLRVWASFSNTYIEVSFESDALCNEALAKEIVIWGRKITVIKTLDKNIHPVCVDITQIPIESSDSIRKRLTEALADYGDILELGIYVSETGSWFTGRGYATLNIDESKVYNKKTLLQTYHFCRNICLYFSNVEIKS